MRVSIPLHYFDEEILPVFVYGTLMRGFGNHALLMGKYDEITEATLEDFDMYDVVGGSFPGIVSGTNTVKGELVKIKPYLFFSTLLALDFLEGFDPSLPEEGVYLRKKVKVKDSSGELVLAYVYVWNSPVDEHDKVKEGCWRSAYLDLYSRRRLLPYLRRARRNMY